MIKLKNSEISAFGNPIINKLFEDPQRRFPVADAFVLADLMGQIQEKLRLYQTSVKSCIEANNGKINGDGRVVYESLENQQKSMQELDELNKVEVEIIGDKLSQKDSWPELAITEAYVLRPLIKEK